MTNELQIFENAKFGKVRTLVKDGEPYFVGKDVAEILGYKDTVNALKSHVDEEDKTGWQITTPSRGTQTATIINESGVYALIFGSKLSKAKAFKRWVTSEVLPAIRKTGGYTLQTSDTPPTSEAPATGAKIMKGVITIGDVSGYVAKDGVVWLSAEGVARGWGFTTVAKSGNEVVRWARVNEYLKEFGSSQHVAKNDFLPENMVYRLGFKANNERARAFQARLADEVLPAIRETGSYTLQTSDTLPTSEAPAAEKPCTFLGMPVYTSGQVARMFDLPAGNVVHICASAAAKMSREKDYTVLKGNALRTFKAQNPNEVVVSVRWLCVVFETGVAKIKKYLHSLAPAAKPQRLCVDVPDNREIQKKIAALRKTITALSALVDTYDAYHLPEEAKGLATAIQQVSCRVSLDAFQLTKLPGNLIPV